MERELAQMCLRRVTTPPPPPFQSYTPPPSLPLCDVNQPVAKSARSRAGVSFSLFKGTFMGAICLGPTI